MSNDDLDPDGKFKRGLLEEHDENLEEEYAQFCLNVYKSRTATWVNELLLEYFKKDFKEHTTLMFQNLPQVFRRDIRDHLRSHGVFVPVGQGLHIGYALDRVRREDLRWTLSGTGGPIAEQQTQEAGPVQATTSTGHVPTALTVAGIDAPHIVGNQVFTPLLSGGGSNMSGRSTQGFNNLMKAYDSETYKYSGAIRDNFEKKFKIFIERCEQCCILEEEKPRAFSLMLSGAALEYYFSHVKGVITNFNAMVQKVKWRFLTEERTLAMTHEWESTSLSSYIKENPTLSKKESLEKMISRLQDVQVSLPVEYRSNVILKNKILMACADIEECRLARQKVAPTVEGVIADLDSSISTSKPTKSTDDSNALITDLITTRKRFGGTPLRKPSGTSGKKCYVCKKEGCWSTNHTKEERMAAIRKNKDMRAFVIDCPMADADDKNSEECPDDPDALAVQLDEIIEQFGGDLKDIGTQPSVNFTSASALFTKELRDNTVVHTISRVHASTGSKRYSNGEFCGVAIDTCVSHHSVGSVKQYEAYCAFVGTEVKVDSTKSTKVGFRMGGTHSKGVATCTMPIGSIFVSFLIHVVDADIPILLSLSDLDKNQLVYDNIKDILLHKPTGTFAPVARRFGHPMVIWNRFKNCLFTLTELKQLHRRFGHP